MAIHLPQAHLKRSMPSLIGGIFSGIVAFVLWLLLFGADNISMIVIGLVVAAALGTWIRLADL
jgi:hypothetical protein